MKNLKLLWVFAALGLFSSPYTQADTEEDGQLWLNINAQGSLPVDGLNWYAEVQPRWREEGSQLDQLLLRPALLYKTSKQSSVWLGYANVINHPQGKPTLEEHRLWQQFSYHFEPMNTFHIQSRTRFEQRHFEHASDTGYRLRQMIKVTKPLQINSTLSWVISDELFFNLNDTDYGARSGFDRNRLFGGVAWVVSPTVKVEAGYLNQYVNRPSKIDKVDHVLSTTVGFSF